MQWLVARALRLRLDGPGLLLVVSSACFCAEPWDARRVDDARRAGGAAAGCTDACCIARTACWACACCMRNCCCCMEIIICCLRGNVRRPSPRTEDADKNVCWAMTACCCCAMAISEARRCAACCWS